MQVLWKSVGCFFSGNFGELWTFILLALIELIKRGVAVRCCWMLFSLWRSLVLGSAWDWSGKCLKFGLWKGKYFEKKPFDGWKEVESAQEYDFLSQVRTFSFQRNKETGEKNPLTQTIAHQENEATKTINFFSQRLYFSNFILPLPQPFQSTVLSSSPVHHHPPPMTPPWLFMSFTQALKLFME